MLGVCPVLQGDQVRKGQPLGYVEQLGTFWAVEVSCLGHNACCRLPTAACPTADHAFWLRQPAHQGCVVCTMVRCSSGMHLGRTHQWLMPICKMAALTHGALPPLPLLAVTNHRRLRRARWRGLR